MRIAIRIGVAALALLTLSLIALAVVLPRVATSAAVQDRIRQAASEATGAEVGFEALSFGLVPPRLVVTEPHASEPGGAKPVVQAESVDLKIQLLPLFARTVVVDSLVVEGVSLRLKRTKDGLELPFSAPAETPSAGGGTPAAPGMGSEPAPSDSGFHLAIGELVLRRAHVVFEDRAVNPPVTWELVDLDATARGSSLDAPIDVDLSGKLASGGKLRLSGNVRLDGGIDLEATLDGVALAPARPYATGMTGLAGSVSGKLSAAGTLDSPSALRADLVLDQAEIQVDEMAFQGRLQLEATLQGGAQGLAGPFKMDATGASVRYGEFFQKPPGKEAMATGKLAIRSGGELEMTDLHLKIQDFEAEGRLSTGARTRLELAAPPFEVAGLAPLLPSLASYQPSGRLALEQGLVETEPLSLRGRMPVSELRVRPGSGEPIVLRGLLEAKGTTLESQQLEAVVGGQTVRLDVKLAGLSGNAPRYRFKADTESAELQALLRAFGGQKDVISGPLTASADLSGPLGGEEPLRAVSGSSRLAVGRGKLRGVSLLEGTVERLGVLGAFAFALGSAKGGSSLQRFYGDEFESISGSFQIGDGRARSRDLQLLYRHYQVDLDGSLGLVDTSLDFKGHLTIHPEVDAALQGEASSPGREKVIPLAHIGGTLGEPRIELTREAVVALAASPRRSELEEKIDERLGEGSGREVLDALEGLLGGRKRP
jgi:hypothetical protein